MTSAEARKEVATRLAAAKRILDAAVAGDPRWLRSDVLHALAALITSAARFLTPGRRSGRNQ